MRTSLLRIVFLSALALPALAPTPSRAQTPDPRDYEVGYFVPNKTTIINTYLRNVSGVEGRDFSIQALALRATYIAKLGDLVITPLDLIVPIQNLTAYTSLSALGAPFAAVPGDLKLATHASGLGDVTYLPTIGHGLLQDAADHTHTWYALTAYITAPLGQYDPARLANVGSNRWTFNPLIVIGQRFLRALTVEAMANVAFYTNNDEYRVPVPALAGQELSLEQKPSFGGALHLAADLHPLFFVGVSYLVNVNGERSFELPTGAEQEDAASTTVHTVRVNFGIRITPQTSILAQWNEDVAGSDDAVITRFVGLRLTHAMFKPAQAPAARQAISDPAGQPAQVR